jgi:hypothetical protein
MILLGLCREVGADAMWRDLGSKAGTLETSGGRAMHDTLSSLMRNPARLRAGRVPEVDEAISGKRA